MLAATMTNATEEALAGLFPPGTAVAALVIADNREPPLPAEAAAVSGAIPRRQAEFAAGRAAARAALRALGHAPVAIPSGPQRQPLWPAGIGGSIAHAAGLAVAALRRGGPLGIDIEPDQGLDADLWPLICTPEERAALPVADRGAHVRRVFAAKEAVFKAQFPVTGAMLGFDDVTVRLTAAGFVARFARQTGPFAAGQELPGRLVRAQGLILTGVSL